MNSKTKFSLHTHFVGRHRYDIENDPEIAQLIEYLKAKKALRQQLKDLMNL